MNSRQDEHIVAQAAEWVAALPSITEQQRIALANWLMESPRHLEEFFLMSALDAQLDGIDAEREYAVPKLQSNIVPLDDPRPQSASAVIPITAIAPTPSRPWLAAAAVLTTVIIAGAWSAATYTEWYGYSTAVGEIRSFELEDGSVIYLNTHSRVKVSFDEKQRALELIAGEAIFKVEQDAKRPFRVRAGNAVIQALGTQFNVIRRQRATTVSVIEGAVGISVAGNEGTSGSPLAHLDAGLETRITASGNVAQPVRMDPSKVTAWQQRRLLFKDDTLADIAAEFNRYNRRPQIRLADEEAAGKKLTGVFDADAPDSLLSFLRRNPELSFTRTEDVVTIGSRRPANGDWPRSSEEVAERTGADTSSK